MKKAGSVFGSIITNPVKFIGNLVSAIRNGFTKFKANIGKHLQNGLASWLFGALSGAGLVMPAQLDIKGVFSLVLQVLNFTYENVRARLAKKVGGQKVNRLEQSVDVLKKIASGGLVTIWQDIAQYVGNLKDLVIGGIKDWVINTIISQAIGKLISMFTPAGAFIQAVVTIYNTVMFFIERASQIAALANSIFNSIGKIAAGDTGAASNYIEQSMARTLPVMISFLARLIGLGGISQKIKDIIKRIQAPVNKAIDKVVDTIVAKGKAVLSGSNNQTQKPQPLGAVGHKPRTGNTQKPGSKATPTQNANQSDHDRKVKAGLAQIDEEEKKYLNKGKIKKTDAETVAKKVKKDNPIFKAINVVDGGKTWDYDWVASRGRKKGEPKAETDQNNPEIIESEDPPKNLPSFKHIFHHGTTYSTAEKLKKGDIQAIGGNDFGKGFYVHTKENWHKAKEWVLSKKEGWGVVSFPIPDEIWEKEIRQEDQLIFRYDKDQPHNMPINPDTGKPFKDWAEFVYYNKEFNGEDKPKEQLPSWQELKTIRSPLGKSFKKDEKQTTKDNKLHQVTFTETGVYILNLPQVKKYRVAVGKRKKDKK